MTQAGADVDARDAYGSTPLLLAAASGHADVVLALVARGADPNASGAHDIPLHRAVASGNLPVLKALLAAGANTGARLSDGSKTALHVAACTDEAEAAGALLLAGAAVDEQDTFLFTPLHFAAGRGNEACARVLLHAGADVSARDVNSFTPLHLAAGAKLPPCPAHLHAPILHFIMACS